MIPYKSPVLTAVPKSLEKRLEIMHATRALNAPDGDDRARKRCGEIASIRRELVDIAMALVELRREYEPRLRSYVIKYSPDQPRVPAGNRDGGQWTSGNPDDARRDSETTSDAQSIVSTARHLNLAARPDAYQRCLDLCYPLLERFQAPGSDRNTWDFHRCMNECLATSP